MIKLITNKKHRFNKNILLKDRKVFVNNKGEIDVDESLVALALNCDFELVDKNAKFTSIEEQKQVKAVEDIINSSRETAKEIIEEAKREAERIIFEANKKANKIIEESNVEEKDEFTRKLQGRKVEELREVLASSDIYTEEEYKAMKKNELIDAIVKIRFS